MCNPWTNRMFHGLLQGRLYATNSLRNQLVRSNKSPKRQIEIAEEELSAFIGTTFNMSLFGITNTRGYWSAKSRVGLIADSITQKQWEEIKANLHLVDNSSLTPEFGPLAKVPPTIAKFNQTACRIDLELHCSVDENTIPCKGKKSKLRQYNPKKPNRWGCKLFMLRSGKYGIIHTVELYTGKDARDSEIEKTNLMKSSQVVARLCETLPSDCIFKLAYIWFSSVEVMKTFAQHKISSVCTFQNCCFQTLTFLDDKAMKETGRCSSVQKQLGCARCRVTAVKWFDNCSVFIASNYVLRSRLKVWSAGISTKTRK